jgi:hypothetical protein
MSNAKFVILGGGMVAGYAAKQLVELGLKGGELAIVSADSLNPVRTASPVERLSRRTQKMRLGSIPGIFHQLTESRLT